MPINDPGNAGTASRPADQPDNDDQRRRVNALMIAILSAVVLLPSIVLAALLAWQWLAAGLGVWLVSATIVSGITTYRYGPKR